MSTIKDRQPEIDRFLRKVNQEGPIPSACPELGPCWLWEGATDRQGYGVFRDWNQRQVKAHRWAYEEWVGEIPRKLLMLHHCDTTSCVNPIHLRPGTALDNQADVRQRDRWGARREQAPLNARKQRRGAAHPNAKLTESQVRAIRKLHGTGLVTYKALADKYGVSTETIRNKIAGKHC